MDRSPRVALVLTLLFGLLLPLLASPAPLAAADGPVWTWGRDSEEMLANGPGASPRAIPGPALRGGTQLSGFIAVAADYRHTLALKADGTVWAWGWDYYGQLGDGTVREPVDDTTPDQVVGLTGVVDIAAGGHISVALKGDGTVWAWGSNYGGRLGIGPQLYNGAFDFPIPQQVSGLSGVVAIAATLDNGYAVKADGTVWVWGGFCHYCTNRDTPPPGWNNSGLPIQVVGVDGVVAVTADRGSVIGRRADGTLLSWGENAYGELGQPGGLNSPDRQPPAVVAGMANVVAASLDNNHTLALKGDGTVWAWGWDSHGLLGDGTAGNPDVNPTPRQVAGLANITQIDAGEATNFALRADGVLFGWGANHEGQLGLGPGAAASYASPQRVPGMVGVQAVAAGPTHTVAIGEYVTAALSVMVAGAGGVTRNPTGDGGGPFTYTPGTTLTLTPQPDAGQMFIGWLVDGVYKGWANPLTITIDAAHTVQATFAPINAFDVPAQHPAYDEIVALAARGTIRGYSTTAFGADDGVQRAQMAALIARAMPSGPGTPPSVPASCLVAGSWDCEDWGNDFKDRNGLDANLWRNVGTLQHYQVAKGYDGAACTARNVPSPCFAPTAPVSYVETITFITRGMIAKGYWVAQPNAPLPDANVPGVLATEVRTFAFYTGSLPALPAGKGWNDGATRGWFAMAAWAAGDSYWGKDGMLPDGRPAGGFVP